MSDISWRFNIDGTQGLSTLANMDNATKRLGNTLRNELAQKLKTVFTVTAIEETVRRTADWATQIEQTSKQLGISGEALQTLQNIAGKTGMPGDAVTGMFENIAKARDEALAGNTNMQTSFSALGVTIKDLQTMTKSGLFGKVLEGIPDNITKAGNFTRLATQQVTGGTPENFIEATKQEVGEKGFEAHKAELLKKEAIQNEQALAELTKTWTTMWQTLKETGTKLTPVVTFLVGILNTLANAIAGAVDLIDAVVHGDGKTALAIVNNASFGVAKSTVGLASKSIGAISPGLGTLVSTFGGNLIEGFLTKQIKKQQDLNNKATGADKTTIERGEAIGNTALMLAPVGGEIVGGAKLAGKAGSTITKKLLSKVGVEKDVADFTSPIKNIIENLRSKSVNFLTKERTGFGKAVPPKLPSPMSASDIGKILDTVKEPGVITERKAAIQAQEDLLKARGINPGIEGERGTAFFERGPNKGRPLTTDEEDKLQTDLKKAAGEAVDGARLESKEIIKSALSASNIAKGGAGLYGAVGAGTLGVANASNKGKLPGSKPIETTPILPLNAMFQDMGKSNNSMMSIGGTFGSGFQSRVIALNQQMVEYLAQIARYTAMDPTKVPSSEGPGAQPSNGF